MRRENKNKQKKKKKKKKGQGKVKGLTYKFCSNIETSIDMKGILKERILDAKIKFTLKEALRITKKDFNEFIIDIMNTKFK